MDELYRKRRQSMLAVEDLRASLIETLETLSRSTTPTSFSRRTTVPPGQHRLTSGKKHTGSRRTSRSARRARREYRRGGACHLVANIDLAPTFAALAARLFPASSWPLPRALLGRARLHRQLAPGVSSSTDSRMPCEAESGLVRPDRASDPDATTWSRSRFRCITTPPEPSGRAVFQGLRTDRPPVLIQYSAVSVSSMTRHRSDQLDNAYDGAIRTGRPNAAWLNLLRHCAGATCAAARADRQDLIASPVILPIRMGNFTNRQYRCHCLNRTTVASGGNWSGVLRVGDQKHEVNLFELIRKGFACCWPRRWRSRRYQSSRRENTITNGSEQGLANRDQVASSRSRCSP